MRTNISKPGDTGSALPQRILLIDDNRHGLLARKGVLEGEGYHVTACESAEEALSRFASESFDLMVTDYRMPNMNGMELIQAIRMQHPHLPIILVSGMVDVLGLNEQNTGADAVIAKNAAEVQSMVRTVSRLIRKSAKKPVRSQSSRNGSQARAR